MFDVTISVLPAQRLLCVPHSGSYMGIGKAFEALYGTLFSRNIFQPDMRMIGLFLDDPELVAEEKLRSFACVTAGADRGIAPTTASRSMRPAPTISPPAASASGGRSSPVRSLITK